MKRILSFLLALALMLSIGMMPAFAALTKAQRVNIEASSRTFRVGRTYQLSEKVYPTGYDYDDVSWETDDADIADVDDYGEIRAYKPGEVTVTCRIYAINSSGKKERVGIGYQTFTVRDRDGNIVGEQESSSSSSSSKTSSSKTETAAGTGGKISAAEVTAAVRNSLIPGTTTSTTFKNAGSVSSSSLKSASLEMQNGGGVVLLNFDTVNGGVVEGRVTINPMLAENVRDDIKLGIYTNDGAVSKVRSMFQKYFKNNVVLIKADQNGSYGMQVTYTVKVDSSFKNSLGLVLYSYNSEENKYYTVKDSNIWLDSNGYVHFTTDLGDYLVVSNGTLTIK